MIKFFRKIRQTLLSEGKTRAYVKYALGEVILVVIGILIALQINNWNNNNQQRKIEIKYLIEIKENLKNDLSDVEFNIDFNKSKSQSNRIILQFLNGKTKYVDSLEFHFSNLMFTTRTLANMSAYESLKSRGLEIVTNDSLRLKITKLYEFDYYNTIDFETKDDHVFQYQILIPEVTKALNIIEFNVNSGLPAGSAVPINKELFMSNYSLKNALMVNYTLRQYMINSYMGLKEDIESVIEQIEKELKNK